MTESASVHHFHSDSTDFYRDSTDFHSLLGPKLAPLPIRRALRGARQRHPWRRVRRRKTLGFKKIKKEPRPPTKNVKNEIQQRLGVQVTPLEEL